MCSRLSATVWNRRGEVSICYHPWGVSTLQSLRMKLTERLSQAKPMIMGILNVTPDSFSDGGRYTGVDSALEKARAMLQEGALIIDVGGESTRPGSERVPADGQLQRVVPVIEALREMMPADRFISIDTTLSRVAEAALDAGADCVNDVSAGRDDPGLFELVAARNVPLMLMHMQGEPKTMQDNPHYEDAVTEVLDFLMRRIDAATAAGVPKHHLVIDPGIGFGKRKIDNLKLLAHLDSFVATGFPVLLGTSRKRFMGSILDVTDPTELVAATVATTTLGVVKGVRLFRVHDVKENYQALEVAWAIQESR